MFCLVYVVPAKDTTITNFIISDTAGVATLKDVPYGNYVFHIEMMGYKHYSKEKYFREERVDLGTVKMKLDENYLSAITVSEGSDQENAGNGNYRRWQGEVQRRSH